MRRRLHLSVVRDVDVTLNITDRRLVSRKAYKGEIKYEDGQFDFEEIPSLQPDNMECLRTYPRNRDIRETLHGHLRHNQRLGHYRLSFVLPEGDVHRGEFDYIYDELDKMLDRLDREISESWGQTP